MGTFGGIQVNVPHTWTGLQTFDAGIAMGSGVIQFRSDDVTIFEGSGNDLIYDVDTGDIHIFRIANSTEYQFNSSAFTIGNGNDIVLATSTGTKIGTGTTQKLAFWDSTPVVQPGHITNPTDLASAIVAIDAILADLAELGLQAAS